MKSYRCKKSEKTIHFLPDAIKFCCTGAEGPGIRIIDFNQIDLKKAEQKRLSVINSLMRGKIPSECKGCSDFEEQDIPGLKELIFGVKNEKKISHIIIDNFKQCDCNCSYCTSDIMYPGSVKLYPVLPVLKELYLNNAISSEPEVEFQGGSVGVWDEFVPVLQELSRIHCKKYNILTNGIKYEPYLEEIARTAEVVLCISLDCGSTEKFREIKNSDAFDTVVENISRYRRANINVNMKYILLENINDYPEEISKFLDIARAFGCPVTFDLDYRKVYFGKGDSYVMPQNYFNLAESIKRYCEENRMGLSFNPELKKRLEVRAN